MEQFIRKLARRAGSGRSSASITNRARRTWKRMVLRRRKRVIRYSLLAANACLLVAVVLFVAKMPAQTPKSGLQQNAVAGETSEEAGSVAPLDKVSSADIAVNVARTAGLPETTSVTNHADSINAESSTVSADSTVIAKPQVIGGSLPSKKDIRVYTVIDGDTISSIASKLGVSSDSIRWSNGLSGERVSAGKQLVVPPSGVNGIVYTVAAGDTPDSLAAKYNAEKDLIVSFNDAEVAGLRVGERILIPNGVVVSRPVVAASYTSSTSFAWGGSSAVYSANGYDYGWCTWWAAKRRADMGMPLPSNLGNANSWRTLAGRAGLGVDRNPTVGSVAWYATIGGLGHVGFVERVNPDGSIWISDMNYYGVSQIDGSTPAGGWGRTSYHKVTPGEFGQFFFIH